MSFFEQQHRARKRTGYLVTLFLSAVLLTLLALNAAGFLIARFAFASTYGVITLAYWLAQPYWIWITVATLVVVLVGSLRTLFKLSDGGKAVAKMVGARRIKMSSQDPQERRLINVVEEMAIASGTPVPALYVMDDEGGINAFVAGYRPNQAVMVVTQGTLAILDRDELQGVVGHEFSHILNGDMRMNIRLMATLAGILVIGQMGGFMLRGMRFSRRGGKSGGAPILAAALALFVIGYIGLFFGRLIKAAISRQREYLADASSVQFTRNPQAIAGALWKIKTRVGSRLLSSHAEDMSHMCIAQSLNFSSLMATHPPLEDRINAVDPHFMTKKKFEKPTEVSQAASAGEGSLPEAAIGFAGDNSTPITTTSQQVTDSVGNPRPEHLAYAHQLRLGLPEVLLNSARSESHAPLVVYALILAGTDDGVMNKAFDLVKTTTNPQHGPHLRDLVEAIDDLGARGRLPLLDIVLPALSEMTEPLKRSFLDTVNTLVKMDHRFTLFEFALVTILANYLAPDADRADRTKYYKAAPVLNEIRVLLSVLAQVGAGSDASAKAAFTQVMRYFTKETVTMAERSEFTPDRLQRVLNTLFALSPLVKHTLIGACADCVLHDGKVMPGEAELLRATSLTLDCPMPPLLPESKVA